MKKISDRARNEHDEYEAKLLEFAIHNKIPFNLFTRVEKGVYLYQEKQLYFKLFNGQLLVKSDNNEYKSLHDFFKAKNSSISPKKVFRPSKSLTREGNNERSFYDSKPKVAKLNLASNTESSPLTQRDASPMTTSSRLGVQERENSASKVIQLRKSVGGVTERGNVKIKLDRHGSVKLKNMLLAKGMDISPSYYTLTERNEKLQKMTKTLNKSGI